jgi:chromosome partitioning protein
METRRIVAEAAPSPSLESASSSASTSVALADAELAKFENILKEPQPNVMRKQMLALTWEEFERFVRYVFECVGYTVEHVGSDHAGHHVDLHLYEGSAARGRPVALVEVRHYRSAELRHQLVAAFVGNLVLAGAKRGYMVTTSGFTAPARSAAKEAGQRGVNVCLTDWRHLTRYLAYLRGSRITGHDGRLRTPRPTPPDWLNAADTTPRWDPGQTTILAISNNRGGVAKTTSALSLALALVAAGKRVLLLDLDGQANLTLALPAPAPSRGRPALPERTIVEFLAGRATLAELARPTRRERLWLVPGSGELYTRDRGGGADPEAELAFVRALHTLEIPTSIAGAGRFDWIILDTPPAQSSYTRAALAAAHVIILPAIAEPFAAKSINRLVETARTMHGLMGRDGRILGAYAVRWPRRPNRQQQSDLAGLKQSLLTSGPAVDLFDALIPEDTRISVANKRMIEGGIGGIFAYRSSAAARAYRELLAELERKMHT